MSTQHRPDTDCAQPQAFNPEPVRRKFPIFTNQPGYVFLDNAATSQKPASVIETGNDFRARQCANAGRGNYSFAVRAAKRIELSRRKVASFLNAQPDDIAFTSGASDSLKLVSTLWGLSNLDDGDEIMLCPDDHRSSVSPWHELKAVLSRFGRNISLVQFNSKDDGTYDLESIRSALSKRTRLIALTHVHNVYGMENRIKDIRSLVGDDVLLCLDASQSIGHCRVDVADLQADFICFSGHKMFADFGIGVLWVAPQTQRLLRPGQSEDVRADEPAAGLKTLVERGTLNIPAILTLVPAIELIEEIGLSTVVEHNTRLSTLLLSRLRRIAGVEFAPGLAYSPNGTGLGVIAFRISGVDSLDLAAALGERRFLVRGGEHCLARSGGDYIRLSLHVYNTQTEVDAFIICLEDLLK